MAVTWLLFATLAATAAMAPNSVVTELVSPWAETPLLLEGLELYAQHAATPSAFWDFQTAVRSTSLVLGDWGYRWDLAPGLL